MKILESIQNYFEVIGIVPSLDHRLNEKNVTILLLFGMFTVATNIFFVYEAENFREATNSFYAACSATLTTFSFAAIIGKTNQIFDFIESFRNIITKSMYWEMQKHE